jgi:putative sugar O-methyltransferase
MWLAPKIYAEEYEKVVITAIDNEFDFKNFKSNSSYNSIVGMSTVNQADVWYENIKKNYPKVYKNLNIFMKNDEIGNPEMFNCPNDNISISPNTLRYINSCIEIENYFKFEDKEITIAELGVGYGGLAFVANKFFNVKEYTLLDLPNVQKLTKKYLDALGVNNHTTSFKNKTDLFISEFCLSEFDDDEMYEFFEKYILKSKNIYLLMNLHEDDRKNKFITKLSQYFSFEIFDEFPKSYWPNYIIMGKRIL